MSKKLAELKKHLERVGKLYSKQMEENSREEVIREYWYKEYREVSELILQIEHDEITIVE